MKNKETSSTIIFHDCASTSLKAGLSYSISVDHHLDNVDTQDYFANSITQNFDVRAPRFKLPSDDVHSLHPAKMSQGRFSQELPSLVLNETILPWEVVLSENMAPSTPWVVLLVFTKDDLVMNSTDNTSIYSGTISDLIAPSEGVALPNYKNLTSTDQAESCNWVEVKGSSLAEIMPTMQEVPYLSHIREIDLSNKNLVQLTSPTATSDQNKFSVVIANRFPNAVNGKSTQYYAHLVSLEGWINTAGTGFVDFPTNQNYRLLSLYNWSFTSLPEKGASFEDLAENFVHQENGNPDNLLLKIPLPENIPQGTEGQFITDKLNSGFAPLNYNLVSGEKTMAWYRGPFTAAPTPAVPYAQPFTAASAAMIYNKTYGTFDQSYACAWQIGRMRALSDSVFANKLMDFRRKANLLIATLAEKSSATGLADKPYQKRSQDRFDDFLKNSSASSIHNKVLSTKPIILKTLTSIIGKFSCKKSNPKKLSPHLKPKDKITNFINSFQSDSKINPLVDILKIELESELTDIIQWAIKLHLLNGVPFDYLVPNDNMLPVESFRFFYIDENWLVALLDGALTIGMQSSQDQSLQNLVHQSLQDLVNAASYNYRNDIPINLPSLNVSQTSIKSGFLIRSQLVESWPALSIEASKAGVALKIQRIEHLAKNVLLCLFNDIPDNLTITEPEHGLQFGMEDAGIINLRSITSGPNEGSTNGKIVNAFDNLRNKSSNLQVLSVSNILQAMSSQMGISSLTVSAFSLQMIKAPEQLAFLNKK